MSEILFTVGMYYCVTWIMKRDLEHKADQCYRKKYGKHIQV